jgi:predicted nucleotidyltransferase
MLASNIGNALFTKAQQNLLGLLYGNPDKSFYLNEIARTAAMGKGAITRELAKLTDAGILTISKQGNQNHYQANHDCPIYDELKQIVLKTFGIKGVIQSGIAELLQSVDQAFIYGSVAKGEEHVASDIDLMLIGDDLSYSEVMEKLEPLEAQLHRQINPSIYTVDEFSQRIAEGQNFLSKVMQQPRIDLLQG